MTPTWTSADGTVENGKIKLTFDDGHWTDLAFKSINVSVQGSVAFYRLVGINYDGGEMTIYLVGGRKQPIGPIVKIEVPCIGLEWRAGGEQLDLIGE